MHKITSRKTEDGRLWPAHIPHCLRVVLEALMPLYTLAACTCQGAEWAATASDKTPGQEIRETYAHVRDSLTVRV